MRPTHIDTSIPAPAQSAPLQASPERVVSAKELLGGAQRVWIEHAAERYLLQITRSGKLILTK